MNHIRFSEVDGLDVILHDEVDLNYDFIMTSPCSKNMAHDVPSKEFSVGTGLN
jgi:hypothetical protein